MIQQEDTLKAQNAAQEATKDAGVAEADMDTDYVADVTVAQGTWDLWPTPTQD